MEVVGIATAKRNSVKKRVDRGFSLELSSRPCGRAKLRLNMPESGDGLDFEEILRNAAADGIDRSEIAIIYQYLTVDEVDLLKEKGLLVADNGDTIVAKFPTVGLPPFAEKATGVLTLGA